MLVTTVQSHFVRSWPPRLDRDGQPKRLRPSDRATVAPIADALRAEYPSDAHFAAYESPNGWRCNSQVFSIGLSVTMHALVFDLDAPGHRVPDSAWRRDTIDRVRALATAHPDPLHYETRGGSRIVYALRSPVILSTEQDAARWSSRYLVACAYLRRAFGLDVDTACCDWTRLFRLPHATRSGGRPERLPVHGDPERIGVFLFTPSEVDVEGARPQLRRLARRGRLSFTTDDTTGEGLLYWLLRGRGDVGPPAPRGGWLARCPNAAAHTTETADDATVVYPPSAGKSLGAICCLHAHCQAITSAEWLRFFSEEEIATARKVGAR